MLLTNPDMIHVSLLPRHERWDDFFFNLRYVVIDEAHTYRGVFGSNVANVLRRLRRVASFYGAEPRFILASATIRNAREHAEHLTGLEVAHVSGDGAPLGRRKIVFWQPPLVEDQLNLRRSSNTEAAELLAELVRNGVRSICFTKSRRAAELIYQQTVDLLKDTDPRLAERITPYRAGYTPEQRRSIETMLFGGQLLAVVSTSALELGIDIGALDAAITVGYPGTMASLWQQWGRAGRGKGESLAVFVAGNDALEQFFVKHPDELLEREVEAATIDFANPFIHGSHLAAAAYEAPLKLDDRRFFGPGLPLALERGVSEGLLRPKGDTWFYRGSDFPAAKIGLRSTAGEQYTIVEEETGDIVGTEGAETAFSALHPGAVYLHMGDTYLVTSLDLDSHTALVRPFWDNYHTLPRRETDTRIISESLQTTHGPRVPPSGGDRRQHPGGRLPEEEDWAATRSWAPRSSICPSRSSSPRACGSPCRSSCSLSPKTWSACPGPSTPSSTPSSPCCRSSPCATAGTSADCRPRCTARPSCPPSSSTTVTRAGSASPGRASNASPSGCATPATSSATAPARAAAPRASSRPSAATGTSPWTRRPPCGFWGPC